MRLTHFRRPRLVRIRRAIKPKRSREVPCSNFRSLVKSDSEKLLTVKPNRGPWHLTKASSSVECPPSTPQRTTNSWARPNSGLGTTLVKGQAGVKLQFTGEFVSHRRHLRRMKALGRRLIFPFIALSPRFPRALSSIPVIPSISSRAKNSEQTSVTKSLNQHAGRCFALSAWWEFRIKRKLQILYSGHQFSK